MSTFVCRGCGKLTNSTCSQFNRGNPPEVCYAAYDENQNWVKGCGFDEAGDFDKAFAMSLITGQPITDFIKKKEE
uniref:Uncharacterized protein n=1 Tax=viral metagenome TaxID=1070528 RepID=A0A6M3K9G7_9ZZZZ